MVLRMKLLLVDDDPDILETCKPLWESQEENIEVETTTTPREALTKIKNKEYDAIIADYDMPKITGLDILKKVRKNGNETPFIILTGQGDEDVAKKALDYKADKYIKKGTDPKKQIKRILDTIYKKPI